MCKWMVCLTTMVFAAMAMPVLAQESASVKAAKELGALLDQDKLDSVAARMSDGEDRFVAALYYPSAQLLVVSARYTVPSLLQEQIWSGKYRDVYTALHGAGLADGKLFVLDMAADGLPAASDDDEGGRADVVYEDGSKQTTFNGDWRGQKLSREEYMKRLEALDARYARMLSALVEELKDSAS